MSSVRRLPVYLLLDTSWSMEGEPIMSVQQGVQMVVDNLQSDPMALETAWLSVITFDSEANVVCPLTEIGDFVPPTLQCNGMTHLGEGIKKLFDQINLEVKKQTSSQRGDYKPMIFIMTDGEPNDSWEQQADRLRKSGYTVLACAAGPDANVDPLKRMTEAVFQLSGVAPDHFRKFFKFVSSSISATSKSLSTGQGPVFAPIDADDSDIVMIP